MAWSRTVLKLTQKDVDDQIAELETQGVTDIPEYFRAQSMSAKAQVYDAVADDVYELFGGKVAGVIIRAALRKVVRQLKRGEAGPIIVEKSHTK